MSSALTLTYPHGTALSEDPAEPDLTRLYAHGENITRLGLIVSAQGTLAAADGTSRPLGGPADLRVLRTLRSVADVVVVGGRTALAEGYTDIGVRPALWEARLSRGQRHLPDLAILTASGRLPAGLDMTRTWVVTTATAPARALFPAERVIVAGATELDPRSIVAQLRERGLTRVLHEGGAYAARLFLEQDAIDEACLTHSPVAGSPTADPMPPLPPHAHLAHTLRGGEYRMERWVMHRGA